MSDEVASLLREIRDNQAEALAAQRDAIALQREHMALAAKQFARAEQLQDRAEVLQSRVGRVQKFALYILFPVILIGLVMLLWPHARYFWWWITQ